MAMAISYNWLFLWDYTFCKWGFLSTSNWFFTWAITVKQLGNLDRCSSPWVPGRCVDSLWAKLGMEDQPVYI